MCVYPCSSAVQLPVIVADIHGFTSFFFSCFIFIVLKYYSPCKAYLSLETHATGSNSNSFPLFLPWQVERSVLYVVRPPGVEQAGSQQSPSPLFTDLTVEPTGPSSIGFALSWPLF